MTQDRIQPFVLNGWVISACRTGAGFDMIRKGQEHGEHINHLHHAVARAQKGYAPLAVAEPGPPAEPEHDGSVIQQVLQVLFDYEARKPRDWRTATPEQVDQWLATLMPDKVRSALYQWAASR